MFLICSFLTIGSNKSNENTISDSYDFESRETVEEYLLDIEDLIETCPFSVKTPINSRRNAVCSRNEMDSIALLEAIADYQREAQANSRKRGNINRTCEISSRRKNISSSTEQNGETESRVKSSHYSFAKASLRILRKKLSCTAK